MLPAHSLNFLGHLFIHYFQLLVSLLALHIKVVGVPHLLE